MKAISWGSLDENNLSFQRVKNSIVLRLLKCKRQAIQSLSKGYCNIFLIRETVCEVSAITCNAVAHFPGNKTQWKDGNSFTIFYQSPAILGIKLFNYSLIRHVAPVDRTRIHQGKVEIGTVIIFLPTTL